CPDSSPFSIATLTWDRSVTSTWKWRSSPEVSVTWPACSSSAMTVHPSSRSSCAVACPMPLLAPVTTAVRMRLGLGTVANSFRSCRIGWRSDTAGLREQALMGVGDAAELSVGDRSALVHTENRRSDQGSTLTGRLFEGTTHEARTRHESALACSAVMC